MAAIVEGNGHVLLVYAHGASLSFMRNVYLPVRLHDFGDQGSLCTMERPLLY